MNSEKRVIWVASIIVVIVLGLLSNYLFKQTPSFIQIVTLFYILQGNSKK